jgi:hypothetical protein
MEVREYSRAKRENDYGLENALAKHVRNKWPDKTIAYVAHEWDLSEAEASKVVYANASKNTLNKLIHHKRGGFGLFLELLCDVTNTKLENYITRQAEEAANERARWEAEERRQALILSRLADCRGLDGDADRPARTPRTTNATLGRSENGRPVEGKSYAPQTET